MANKRRAGTVTVTVTMPEEMKDYIDQEAKRLELDRSSFVRLLVLGEKKGEYRTRNQKRRAG